MDLLVAISEPLLFKLGGFDLIVRFSLAFGLKCGNPPPTPAAPCLADSVLGRTLCVGGKEMLEDAGMEQDGEMEVVLLLLLYGSDNEDKLAMS